MSLAAASLPLAGAVATAEAQAPSTLVAPVRIYIANDDHTDYMWTADADTYNAVFVDMLDYYLDLADKTDSNPSPYQSRFNADGSYWLWQYERQKPKADFDRLMNRIKDGHISAPLNTLVECYGAQPTEAVLRGMYYAGRLERRYDARFPLAVAMENQTLPLGLSSLWAGSGALYSWKGVCGCASRISDDVLAKRNHEIYWYTGLDGQRVLMKWYSLGPHGMGTYLEANDPDYAISYLDSNHDFLSRYTDPKTGKPYSARAAFGFGGDTLAHKTGMPGDPGIPTDLGVTKVIPWGYVDHFFNIAKEKTTPARQVIDSNMLDFFDDFSKNCAADLPSENVTYGNEWDLYSASMAETSARVRRAVEKLRSAELMSTLVSLQRPKFTVDREKARDLAFTDLGLYWEHDWTGDGPVSRSRRAAWQDLLASEIDNYVNPLYDDSNARLGYLIQRPDKSDRIYVLNSLGNARTDYVDSPYNGSHDIHVREVLSGKDVPHQFVNIDGATYLRVLAADVPPTGYKTYDKLSGPGTAPTDDAAIVSGAANDTLENDYVKLSVNGDGSIRSLIDKKRGGYELVGTGMKINDLSPGNNSGTITVENQGPVSVTLRCTSSTGLPHTTWITVYRNSDRIDIRNQITSNFSDNRYWAFGFNLTSPDVHTEELGAILHDKLKSQGGDYADSHARYDHVTLNHFADMTNGADDRGVTLSNADCSFAKLGNSTAQMLDTETPEISVLAGGQVDGRWLGIQHQNGATFFTQRFSIKPHGKYDATDAMTFALEHQNPLVAGGMSGDEHSPYPADTFSLLSSSDPGVLLWSVKPAEEGIDKGVIARVWNVESKPTKYTLTLAGGISSAKRTTHIETDIEPLAVSGGQVSSSIARSQLQTLRLFPVAKP